MAYFNAKVDEAFHTKQLRIPSTRSLYKLGIVALAMKYQVVMCQYFHK